GRERVSPLRGTPARGGGRQRLLALARGRPRRAGAGPGDPPFGSLHHDKRRASPATDRPRQQSTRGGAHAVNAGSVLDAYAEFVGAATIEEIRLFAERLRGRRGEPPPPPALRGGGGGGRKGVVPVRLGAGGGASAC